MVQVKVTIPWKEASTVFDEMWDEDVTIAGVPDMLETMYTQQEAHMHEYAKINPEAWLVPEFWGSLRSPATQAAIRENAGYVVEELMEAVNLLKNKPWKQTNEPVDRDAFREELADVWHFFLQLHIVAGIDPIDIFQAYFKKSFKNDKRREKGY